LDITSEYKVKGTFCDLAVKIDGNVKYLIEAKAIGLDLKETHLRQAVGYGAQHGIQWVVLTNGVDWEIYRIKFERPVEHDLLCAFNILDLNPRKKEDQEILYLLCKEGLSKDVIEEYLLSVNKFIISAILQSDTGLKMIRKELRRVSQGIRVETDEISSILTTGVLKRDVVEGADIKEAHSRVKKASTRKLVKAKPKPPKPSPSP
jgi:predicted type IV restriction endonuclease